ncbi:MAG: selenocysteine-specific translation elongation factor [Pirellulales bacterium]|nr:selenocysteine-specific translation elongation factor [Pirellulales bacterium]
MAIPTHQSTAAPQVNITLGTAGHIDHGKTALVKCLTGCDTDRLKEEKERGMSIELGFAPCTIAGSEVGIVDVPGHENFIKTMVAGAGGMDGVILVVAADDGVMPQTREHLEILTLLGVRHGLVALTKVDRVDALHRDAKRAELQEFLRGTFLEGAPILPLSNLTGEGFNEFLERLWDLVERIEPKRVDGVFRLPLDRAFSSQGFGTIVAGIPVSGSARIGDEITLLPQGLSGRIKRIEVYGRTSEVVLAGQCAAVNVGHWDRREIGRGDVIASPGYFSAEEWFVCRLRLLDREKLAIKSGASVKFHTGTSEVPAMVYPLDLPVLTAAGEYLVQIRAATPVVAGPGDHFILRWPSPVQTIGGGTIIEAVDRRLKRNRPEVLEDLHLRAQAVGDDRRFVEYCIRRAERFTAAEAELGVRTKIPRARLQQILSELADAGAVLPLNPGLYMHRDTAVQSGEQMLGSIAEFHRQSPESPGMPWDDLRQSLQWDKEVLTAVAGRLASEKRIHQTGGRLALPDHRPKLGDEDAATVEAVESLFLAQLFNPPNLEELTEKTRLTTTALGKAVRILREHGRLIAVEDILFHRDAVARAREILVDYLTKEGRLESVQFKYLLNTTRKFAIPLLDYFDRLGVTRRSGHTRFLKAPPGQGRGR